MCYQSIEATSTYTHIHVHVYCYVHEQIEKGMHTQRTLGIVK